MSAHATSGPVSAKETVRPLSDTGEAAGYRTLSSYLKERYGGRVYRVALDAGFSCPNRDGTKATGGCIYCNAEGSRAPYVDHLKPVDIQLKDRMAYLRRTCEATWFIAYFQAFSNTYAPLGRLKAAYDSVAGVPGVVGISVGTRPDVATDGALDLLASYRPALDVTVEYGLQSAHEKSLLFLGRMHTVEDFTRAAAATKQRALRLGAHVIIGIPGETRSEVIETARYLSDICVDEVKIHPLHVLRGSRLEALHASGAFVPLEMGAYADLVCDFLEHLDDRVVIARVTGQGAGQNHIGPAWALDKSQAIRAVSANLARRGTRQGSARAAGRGTRPKGDASV